MSPAYSRAVCKHCNLPIYHNGKMWDHEGDHHPRHIAAPHEYMGRPVVQSSEPPKGDIIMGSAVKMTAEVVRLNIAALRQALQVVNDEWSRSNANYQQRVDTLVKMETQIQEQCPHLVTVETPERKTCTDCGAEMK